MANEANDGTPPVIDSLAFATDSQDGMVRIDAPYTIIDGFRRYDFSRGRTRELKRHHKILALAIAQVADCGTTNNILSRGGRELNPIARILGIRSLPLCLVVRLAADIIGARSSSIVNPATVVEGSGAVLNALEIMR